MQESNEWLSVTRAAEVAGVSVATIRRACKMGHLLAHKIGERGWAISARALHHWHRSPRGRKTPEKSTD